LEAAAFAALYALIVGHLWVVTTRCRVASPLYAVPADDVASDPPVRGGRPLYCGSSGTSDGQTSTRVCGTVGSHAPTRMVDWEALSTTHSHFRWRDRCALRHCAESLAAREAHLLSHLDALEVRIGEAEVELARGPQCSWAGLSCSPGVLLASMAVIVRALAVAAATAALAAITLLLCAAAARGWQPSWHPDVDFSPRWYPGGGMLEATLWMSLLLRVGQCWYSVMIRTTLPSACWSGADTEVRSRAHHSEVACLRQQACDLHRSLAETQHMLCCLEDNFDKLGLPLERQRSSPASSNRSDAAASNPAPSPSAMRALTLGWLGSALVAWLPLAQTTTLVADYQSGLMLARDTGAARTN